MSKDRFLNSNFKYKEEDPSFYGEELDFRYRRGPIQERKCTDIFCCLIFLALIGGMCYVGVLGYQTGKPSLLASPFDEDNKQCGVAQGYQNYPKIFISRQKNSLIPYHFVCVKHCPSSVNDSLECKKTQKVTDCELLQIYKSETLVNLCYPDGKKQIADIIAWIDVNAATSLQKYFADLKTGWLLLLGGVFLAIIVSLLFTVFIRHCSGCFVWTTIVLLLFLMIGVGVCSFLIDSNEFLQNIVDYRSLPSNLQDRNYQIACAVICWVLAFLELLISCCFYRQIKVSIGILKAAADFTRKHCYAMLIPIYTILLQIIFLGIWLITILYIFSSEKQITPIKGMPFGFIDFDTKMEIYTALYIIGLFWIGFFLEALGMYWTCSTIAIWYFQEGYPKSPFKRSVCRSLKQLGSLAFGSFILTIMVLIRMTLQFITKMLKQQTLNLQSQPCAIKYLLKCVSCCIACFERVIRFLTSNAYIMMAISGKGFCSSACQSFYLVLKSTMQFAISHGTTKIFIIFGKVMIIAICCLGGYLAITLITQYRTSINSPVFITILFGIISYPIASAFLSMFEMASNTILMCYCLQLDLCNDSNQKCPHSLRIFLKNYVSELSQASDEGYHK